MDAALALVELPEEEESADTLLEDRAELLGLAVEYVVACGGDVKRGAETKAMKELLSLLGFEE